MTQMADAQVTHTGTHQAVLAELERLIDSEMQWAHFRRDLVCSLRVKVLRMDQERAWTRSTKWDRYVDALAEMSWDLEAKHTPLPMAISALLENCHRINVRPRRRWLQRVNKVADRTTEAVAC